MSDWCLAVQAWRHYCRVFGIDIERCRNLCFPGFERYPVNDAMIEAVRRR